MNDIGVSCHKDSYGRTAGTPLTCKPDEVYDAGLCYPPCEHDATGKGPVCWGHCPEGLTPCGGALCLAPGETCSEYITGDLKDIEKAIIAIAMESPGKIIDLTKILIDYTFPVCETWEL